jgi:hypothetical protein
MNIYSQLQSASLYLNEHGVTSNKRTAQFKPDRTVLLKISYSKLLQGTAA